MVKSEVRRLFSDKKFLITFFAVFAFFIVMITVVLFRIPMDNTPLVKEDLNESLVSWQRNYEKNRAIYLYLIGEGENPDGNGVYFGGAETYKRDMEFFRFLLSEASTDPYMHYDFDFEMGNIPAAYRGFYTMMLILKFAFYPFVIFAVISAVVTVVSPYDKGVMKNYLAAPMGKRTVMGGKLFVLAAINLLFWLVIFIWGFIIGAGNAQIKIMFYSGERYYAQPALATYTMVMVQLLVAMLFVAALTVFIGQFVKKSLATGVSSAFAVIAVYCLCTIVSSVAPWELLDYLDLGFANCFPIINLSGVFQSAYDYRMWVAILFHLLVGAGMVAFIILWQTRGEKRRFVPKSQ